jgi:hypothetical protein
MAVTVADGFARRKAAEGRPRNTVPAGWPKAIQKEQTGSLCKQGTGKYSLSLIVQQRGRNSIQKALPKLAKYHQRMH